MWLSNADRQEADQHERQVRAAARMMLPMIDIAGLVERMPEANCRRGGTRVIRSGDGRIRCECGRAIAGSDTTLRHLG